MAKGTVGFRLAIKNTLAPINMTDTLIKHFSLGRFRPVSLKYFDTYAKNLSRFTGDSYQRSRETLAHIYGYSNVHELQTALEEPGIPGPFDDDIPADALSSEEIRDAIEDRNARTMHIILEANQELYEGGAPRPSLLRLYMLQLFNSPKKHLQAFRDLAIPKKKSKERRVERERLLGRSCANIPPSEEKQRTGFAYSKGITSTAAPSLVNLRGNGYVPIIVLRKRTMNKPPII